MKILKIILPILVLAFSVYVARETLHNKPVAEKKMPEQTVVNVEVITLSRQTYDVVLHSQGTVTAHDETTLVSQVSGAVTDVSKILESGQFVGQNEWLLSIDDRDYKSALTIAQSGLAQARLQRLTEAALARQAKREWQRLNPDETPSDLVLRKPQLARSKAEIAAAQAQVDQATLNLQRTQITAPYAAQIRQRSVSIGQFVSPTTPLLSLFSTDYVEVRLPLSAEKMTFLPPLGTAGRPVAATVSSEIGSQVYQWDATITRSEGIIDPGSRQTYIIARIDNPYGGGKNHTQPLKVGQFISAQITALQLDDVIVLDNAVIQPDGRVFIVDSDNTLRHRAVTLRWQDAQYSVIGTGLETTDRVVSSPVNPALIGTKVVIIENNT